MKKILILSILALAALFTASAQPRAKQIEIIMVPDHQDAIYKTGEEAKIKVTTLKNGIQLNGATISYEVSRDLLPAHDKGTLELKGYEGTIEAGTLKKPGYLRVKATIEENGTKYTYYSTVGFDHEKLMPTVSEPKDFDTFWENNLKRLQKVSLDPEMELLPERCTPEVNVYHISYGNIGNSRMYGILTMPVKEGKYPAILRLPGAGVHAKGGNVKDAAKGAIILEIGIHGIDVTLDDKVYDNLTYGALSNYYITNINDRESYYFKRVYLGCVKGVDFLLSLPQCNGNVGTLGGSQGGLLSIVTSALDKRVKASAIYFPAFSDWEGYLHGTVGGFPHFFKNEKNRTKENLETIRYYDAANFARKLTAPVCYAYGYNDLTCGPTTSRATYNAITAKKWLIIGENCGHWLYPEDSEAMWNWIIDILK